MSRSCNQSAKISVTLLSLRKVPGNREPLTVRDSRERLGSEFHFPVHDPIDSIPREFDGYAAVEGGDGSELIESSAYLGKLSVKVAF